MAASAAVDDGNPKLLARAAEAVRDIEAREPAAGALGALAVARARLGQEQRAVQTFGVALQAAMSIPLRSARARTLAAIGAMLAQTERR